MVRRWRVAAGTTFLLGAAIAVVGSMSWTINDPWTRAHVVQNLMASSGLTIVARGPMTVRLLPLPSLEVGDVGMDGLDGAVQVEADGLGGRLSLLGLLRGQLRVLTAILESPTIVVDVDRVGPLVNDMIDSAVSAAKEPPEGGIVPPREPLAFLRTDGLTIRAGVVRFLSQDAQRDTLLTDVAATIAWPEGGGEGRIEGGATWRGTAATFLSVLDAPNDLLVGRASRGSLRLQSAVVDLSATGEIALAGGFRGTGRLDATTADVLGFLRVAGTPLPQLRAFHGATLGGQATLAPNSLSLSDVDLGLDDMSFQGALVVHDEGGRPGLAGTLDTARIDLNPFLSALPSPQAADGTWSDLPFDLHAVADDDIDLRISASEARIGLMAFEDGSLSLQSGRGRMELSLGEARAYDGLLKGRVVATEDRDATAIRADLSVSRLDLAALGKDVPQSIGLAGTATGHIMIEGQGRSYGEALRALDGRGTLSVRSGGVALPLATALVSVPPDAPPAVVAMLNRLASFDSAAVGFDVARGRATLTSGEIVWPDAAADLHGSASIPQRLLAITLGTAESADDETAATLSPAGVALVGPWRSLALTALEAGRPIVNAVER